MSKTSPSIPTIYDVARRSGVSISTVSRVMNNQSQVSAEVRSRVLAAVEELDFVPRADARARAMQGVGRIGVVTPFFTEPAFVQRLRGVAAALRSTPYELAIYTIDSTGRLRGYLTNLPALGHLDGLVILSLAVSAEDAERLVRFHLETVLIEYAQPGLCSVVIDNQAGGRLAAQYLLGKGHRRLAFLGDGDLPDYALRPAEERLAGFRRALEEAGAQLPPDAVRFSQYSQAHARQAARELLSLQPPPSAIFAATDFQAVGVLKVARELGLQVPGDLAVLGFDDLDLAEITGLTTISQHLDESGRIAGELLLGRIEQPDRPPKRVELPLRVMERETV